MTFDVDTVFFVVVSLAMVGIGRKAWQWKASWDRAAVIMNGRRQ